MTNIPLADQYKYVKSHTVFKGESLMAVETANNVYVVTNHADTSIGHLYAHYKGVWYMKGALSRRISSPSRPDPITLITNKEFNALISYGYAAMVAARIG
jgi:hypothetical protein